MEELVHQ
jgi:hypothetical protein